MFDLLLTKAFNPNQARWPMGHPRGGQWKPSKAGSLNFSDAIVFSADESGRQVMERHSLFGKVSMDVQRTLSNYTYVGNTLLNPMLRSREKLSPGLKVALANLDSAFKIASPLEQDTLLFRAVKPKAFGREWPRDFENLVGLTFKDRAFLSTTFLPSVARKFGKVLIRMFVPKGIRAIGMELTTATPGEWEMLLPRGLEFTVRKLWWDSEYPIVDAEVLLP